MKKLIVLFALCTAFPAFADDAPAVAERTDCDALRDEIAQLIKIENPDDETAARLAEIQKISRRDCAKRTGARRTSGRTGALPVAVASELNAQTSDATNTNAMDEYMAKKQENCANLQAEIEKLSAMSDNESRDSVAKLRTQYDADCVTADAEKDEAPELDAETIAANIEAGLCADGEKPNKFGCCAGETFKDLGDLVFACCKDEDDGGECFPPIEK